MVLGEDYQSLVKKKLYRIKKMGHNWNWKSVSAIEKGEFSE